MINLISDFTKLIASSLFVLSWVFLFAETIGIVRLKNIYSRMLISSLLDTVSVILIITGLILYGNLTRSSIKLLVLLAFLLIVNPVSTHLITRSARRKGVGLTERRKDK